jgi:7,8-dihydroneopterin aldolase/epimerase/oxygenase
VSQARPGGDDRAARVDQVDHVDHVDHWDRIELRGLRVLARCGVLPFEREQDQPIEVDLDLLCDLQPAGTSDDLADTVNYGAVCAAVERAAGAEPVALLERLTDRLAAAVLAVDPRVEAVELAVRKLRPPVPQQLATAGIRCLRHR